MAIPIFISPRRFNPLHWAQHVRLSRPGRWTLRRHMCRPVAFVLSTSWRCSSTNGASSLSVATTGRSLHEVSRLSRWNSRSRPGLIVVGRSTSPADDERSLRLSRVVQPHLLAQAGDPAQPGAAIFIALALVFDQIHEAYPAMRAHASVRNLPALKQLDQEGA